MQRLYKIAGALALAITILAAPTPSYAGVFVGLSVNFGPPALPVYVQPPCPAPDWVWTPGYWAYGPYGYYWVPGTWVPDPQVGYYWTPGYWGYDNDNYAYRWHDGYWGRQVGYYGGINYGNGYFGNGYDGGDWYGRHFRYNTAYTNINRTYIRNVYVNRTVVNNYYYNRSRISYNGGPRGIQVRPSAFQLAYASRHHLGPTYVQRTHVRVAASNWNYLAKVNHGQPRALAFNRPLGGFHRPANFTPLAVGRAHWNATYRRPTYRATTSHGTTNDAFRAFHSSTYHASTYRAPVYHAYRAPAYHAPAYRPYRAPAYGTYHAPAYHTYHAPAYRAYRAPAYHAPARSFSAGQSHGGGHPAAGGRNKHN